MNVTEEIEIEEKKIEFINWRAIEKIEKRKETIQVYDYFDVYDENGEQLFDTFEKIVIETNEAGEEIEVIREEKVAKKYWVPRKTKQKVIQKKEIITEKPWKRNHYWLIAQELEEALWGIDFGGLVIDEEGNYAVRYDQLICPLIKAVKELSEKVKILENNQ